MKLLHNKEGFIFREEQRRLIKELGMTDQQFVNVMEEGLGVENMSLSIYEANQIVTWFQRNNYTFDQPKNWISIPGNNEDELEASLKLNLNEDKAFSFRKLEWYDQESGFGKYEVEDSLKERLSLWFKSIPN